MRSGTNCAKEVLKWGEEWETKSTISP